MPHLGAAMDPPTDLAHPREIFLSFIGMGNPEREEYTNCVLILNQIRTSGGESC